MDFFALLDKHETDPGEPIVVARYRIRFHRDVIYSSYLANPSLSQDDIAAAAAINDPIEFLPQPWPPLPLDNTTSLSLASLTKMKALTNVGLGLPEVASAALNDLISRQFPERMSISTAGGSTISSEVRITRDGLVTGGSNRTGIPEFIAGFGPLYRYTKAMLILGMQQSIESLME
jgi:hypothetical protein